MSKILWKLKLSSIFLIYKKQFRIRFFPSSLSAAYWVDPEARKGDEIFLSSYLKKGDLFVDVGANIGVLTLTAAAIVGDSGKVISIEAHPRIYGYLQQNVAMNSFRNISLINAVVGEKKGKVCFSDNRADDQNAVVLESALEVKMDTLDELVGRELKIINLLKVDVEGYEKFVFDGASRILWATECIYFESWEKHFFEYGYSCTDIFSLLANYQFKVYKLNDCVITPITASYCSSVVENMVAIRNLNSFMERTGFTVAVR